MEKVIANINGNAALTANIKTTQPIYSNAGEAKLVQGPPGPPGPTGKSAYESARDGGYKGNEAEFNAYLADIDTKVETTGTNAANAAKSEAAAKAAQKAAEDARDAAGEIVGGDFATKTEAQGYANTAETNANGYTDQKIAAIPAPDLTSAKPFYVYVSQSSNGTMSCSTTLQDLFSAIGSGREVLLRKTPQTAQQNYYYPLSFKQGQSTLVSGQQYTFYFGADSPIVLKYSYSGSTSYPTVSQNSSSYVYLSGGTMTGKLTLSSDPTDALHAATKQYVDNSTAEWAKAASKPSYTANEVGARPSTWTPSAADVSAGTFAGQVVANSSGETYSTYLLRNTRLANADTNPTVNGEICWTYK